MTEGHNALWVSSYPKSGNTWIHSVLRNAGKDFGFPQADMDVYNIIRNGVAPAVCEAVADELGSGPVVVLKTHSAYREEPLHKVQGVPLASAAYIHIYRNPLDVLLSYLNFTRIEYKARGDSPGYRRMLFRDLLGYDREYSQHEWHSLGLDGIARENLDYALDYFSENEFTIPTLASMSGSWLEHTRSWLGASRSIPGTSVRYEDCLRDPAQVEGLARFFKFSHSHVATALIAVNERARSLGNSGDVAQTVFYNKMSAYYFMDYFSKDAIQRFIRKHEQALIDANYKDLIELASA